MSEEGERRAKRGPFHNNKCKDRPMMIFQCSEDLFGCLSSSFFYDSDSGQINPLDRVCIPHVSSSISMAKGFY